MNNNAKENYPELEDEELIRRTLDGQTRAFDELVRRHSRKLNAMLIAMLNNEADAYDVAQTSFLKAFHSLRYFKGQSSFYTWLYSIALNQARNFLRKRKRERDNSYSLDNDENGDPLEKNADLSDTNRAADPVRQANIAELRKKLQRAISQLSPAHREVINLCDIQGLSYPEISKIINISEGTLRSRLHYARRQLQGLLAEEKPY
ncbi:MAG: sigma-70 family RNA polymerase sigma factor [Akkermansia sp.]|nr:sigma-70 family RNA polymerase sigma factor [Akkermansiaceae bacterium]MBQ3143286.1 sigma-70 family RNA polymerase sigma factor [Akkermansia sp.]